MKLGPKPLQQIFKRLSESFVLKPTFVQDKYPILGNSLFGSDNLFGTLEFENFILVKFPDNFCILNNKDVFQIKSIKSDGYIPIMIGCVYSTVEPILTSPETSALNIYIVQSNCCNEKTIQITEITQKCLIFNNLQSSRHFITVPLVHRN